MDAEEEEAAVPKGWHFSTGSGEVQVWRNVSLMQDFANARLDNTDTDEMGPGTGSQVRRGFRSVRSRVQALCLFLL